jgi:AraC-like DNA-binding protein
MRAFEEALRGVLDLRSGRGRFDVTRTRPAPALAELVEHFWTVSWDLRGRAFGIRFRPAGFHPFLGAPVATLTDRRVAVAEVFGPAGDRLVADLLAATGQARLVAAAEAFLLARLPAADPNVVRVNRVVDQIMADRDITRVADVTGRSGIATRRLQRLFATYVGVTPKWVIRRARLHEAVERLNAGDAVDLAFLARELGYFDQAHFARDFRSAVGRPPAAYARSSPS